MIDSDMTMWYERTNDVYNKKLLRDRTNVSHESYNCAGLALNTFTWYKPYSDDMEGDMILYDCTLTIKEKLQMMVDQILIEFDDVRVVTSEDELNSDEYLIALRLSKSDFHFLKKVSGIWISKCGMSYITILKENITETWCNGYGDYNSDIVYLAKKRNINEEVYCYIMSKLNSDWFTCSLALRAYRPDIKVLDRILNRYEEPLEEDFLDFAKKKTLKRLNAVGKSEKDILALEIPQVIGVYDKRFKTLKEYEEYLSLKSIEGKLDISKCFT